MKYDILLALRSDPRIFNSRRNQKLLELVDDELFRYGAAWLEIDVDPPEYHASAPAPSYLDRWTRRSYARSFDFELSIFGPTSPLFTG